MITKKQGFLGMFQLLNSCYDEIENADDLGRLLGDLNPFLFSEYEIMPADPDTLSDWVDIINKISPNEFISENEAFQAVLMFLQFYQNEFDFNLKNLIDFLEDKETSYQKWIDIVEKTKWI